MKIEPIVTENEFVRLGPSITKPFESFCEIGLEEDIRRWNPEQISTPEAMRT